MSDQVSECEVFGRSVGLVRDSNATKLGCLQENSGLRRIRDFDLLIGLPDDADIHHTMRVNWNSAMVPIGDEDISILIPQSVPARKNRDLSTEISCRAAIALEYYDATGSVGGLDLSCNAAAAQVAAEP